MSFPITKCPGCRASLLCHLLLPAHMHIHTGTPELGKSYFWLGMCLGDRPCTIYMVVFILMNEVTHQFRMEGCELKNDKI